ncbi:hypothetical protein TcasGA2_TC011495 [Tribolium castaneum]|uniref:HAT C-terminal dimerisation domain-containing protein n=1 Tax=Tribolium castaneum TaxID=7070 RepID=D7EK79_TRICA|nr:hypothetical protein TcasGA2_TC011495 [Tribolium castaneum]
MLAVSSEADLSGELIEIILDNNGFWENLRILLDVLSYVLTWITLLEADECRIFFVIEAFMEIKEIIDSKFKHPQSSNFKKNILDLLESRKEYTIKDIHKAAHFLNPRSKGNLLTVEESLDAMRFISELASAILPADECQNMVSKPALYRTTTGLFHKEFVWNSLKSQSNGKKLCPIIWWKGICGTTSLSKVAVAILQCPPTTAASSVHTLKRNRLTGERAVKLTYFKHNFQKISAHNHEGSFMDPNDYAASTEPMEYDDEEMDEEDKEVVILEVTDSFTDA